jgi:hypothetical protein
MLVSLPPDKPRSSINQVYILRCEVTVLHMSGTVVESFIGETQSLNRIPGVNDNNACPKAPTGSPRAKQISRGPEEFLGCA